MMMMYRAIPQNTAAVVDLQVEKPICLEPYSSCRALGLCDSVHYSCPQQKGVGSVLSLSLSLSISSWSRVVGTTIAGRIMLRAGNKTVAAGMVLKLKKPHRNLLSVGPSSLSSSLSNVCSSSGSLSLGSSSRLK